MMAVRTLFQREVVRFLRQRSRIIGAVGTPLLFWALLGSGMNRSFSAGSLNYLHYFFPGILVMTILFTAIFSTISIIEDRREGFLQGVLVAPVSRLSFVLGKLLGGAILAVLQSALMLLFAPFIGISFTFYSLLATLLVLFVLALGLTGLGFVIAWRLNSSQGFHAVMNLFLMPLWFLSGAVFPVSGAPAWLKPLMVFNPLTYGVSALHTLFYNDRLMNNTPSVIVCLAAVTAFALAMIVLSQMAAEKRERSA